MKNVTLLLLFTFSSIIATSQGVAVKTKNLILNVDNYNELILGKGVQLIDVRTPKEYADGFIDDAICIDYFDRDNFKKEFEKLDKNKPLYIYCRSGNRSQLSAKILVNLGFKEIYDLKGGYKAWSVQKNK